MINICKVPGEIYHWRGITKDRRILEETDNSIEELIAEKEIANYGWVGEDLYINFDLEQDGSFKIIDNDLRMAIISDDKNLLSTSQPNIIKKIVLYRDVEQEFNSNIANTFAYNVGIRIESDYGWFSVIASINKYTGLSLKATVTPKKDFEGVIKLFSNQGEQSLNVHSFKENEKVDIPLIFN